MHNPPIAPIVLDVVVLTPCEGASVTARSKISMIVELTTLGRALGNAREKRHARAAARPPAPAISAPAEVQITSSRPGPTPISATGTRTNSETKRR